MATSTVVIAGEVRLGIGTDRLDPAQSVLVTGEEAARTYLLYDGRRAGVDLRDAAVVRALRLDGVVPRPVSRALLDGIPEAPAITAPYIPRAGSPGPPALPGLSIGTVVRMARTDASEYYVVLADGVQRIGEVAADLIRFTVAQPGSEIPTVAADALVGVRAVEAVPIGTFPERTRAVDHPIVCAHWAPHEGSDRANTTVMVGNSLPVDHGDSQFVLLRPMVRDPMSTP